MITINNYVKAESLEQAYELNQKKANRVLGGMMWMRLSKGRVQTAIDLSGLGLDTIEENEDEFRIGCMCTLRSLEVHGGLNTYFQEAFKESVRHIVGVQFRNGATVGGSVFGRFGFSDVLTLLLALDSYVELYKGGIVPIHEFVQMERDNDILVRVIVKKDNRHVCYLTERATATDFPMVACAVAHVKDEWSVSVGARPMKADVVTENAEFACAEDVEAFAKKMADAFTYGTNMRGSKEYRKHLTEVLIKRAVNSLMGEC